MPPGIEDGHQLPARGSTLATRARWRPPGGSRDSPDATPNNRGGNPSLATLVPLVVTLSGIDEPHWCSSSAR